MCGSAVLELGKAVSFYDLVLRCVCELRYAVPAVFRPDFDFDGHSGEVGYESSEDGLHVAEHGGAEGYTTSARSTEYTGDDSTVRHSREIGELLDRACVVDVPLGNDDRGAKCTPARSFAVGAMTGPMILIIFDIVNTDERLPAEAVAVDCSGHGVALLVKRVRT